MAQNPRIEDLRTRVQKDPASIAFAQLAEEYRRAGQFQDAVETCRAGLAIHPGYLSARVTLGRALVELHQLEAARAEFETVLKGAPENLAAIRGLAEVYHKSGALTEALAQYRAALALARNDPDLEQIVDELSRQLSPKTPAPPPVVPSAPIVPTATDTPTSAPAAARTLVPDLTAALQALNAPKPTEPAPAPKDPEPAPSSEGGTQVARTIEALEQWLDAIHVSRTDEHS
jgi:tetratricopeptide (TPR) repeat protein